MKKLLAASFIVALITIPPPLRAQGRATGATFTLMHAPSSATQATASQAANPGEKHVADCLMATFAALTTAPTAVQVAVVIRDGPTGAGTILFQAVMSLPATGGANAPPIVACPTGGLGLIGTVNTAMTVEFTASGGTNTVESVFLRGHDER